MAYTFIDLAEEILTRYQFPMTKSELWEKAVELELDKKIGSSGKTPWQSLSACLYVEVRDNPSSIFCKIGKRPVKFALKSFSKELLVNGTNEDTVSVPMVDNYSFNERDLHPLLSSFVAYHEHFKCYTKTI